MSQAEFAKKIGIAQTSYSQIERGVNPVQDRYILLVCNQFGVNEHWLRTGDGDMWQEDEESHLDRLAQRHNLTPRQRLLVKNFLALPEDRREALLDLMDELLPPREPPALAPEDPLPDEIRRNVVAMGESASESKNEKGRDA